MPRLDTDSCTHAVRRAVMRVIRESNCAAFVGLVSRRRLDNNYLKAIPSNAFGDLSSLQFL